MPDFIHKTYELVVLTEGKNEIKIEGKTQQLPIGDEAFIPAKAMHKVRNVGKKNSVWTAT